jgi:hypothetical protein
MHQAFRLINEFMYAICSQLIQPKLNKEVYYTSMEEKQSWGRPSAARISF